MEGKLPRFRLRLEALLHPGTDTPTDPIYKMHELDYLYVHMALEAEHVDDRRHEAEHPVVGRRGEPTRPAALAHATDHEALDPESIRAGRRAGSVHRGGDRGGHRQEERPVALATADELDERMGHEVILHHPATQRLAGDLPNQRRREAGGRDEGGQPADPARGLPARRAGSGQLGVRAAADPQQHRAVADRGPRGEDDVELVDPIPSAPGLARQPVCLPQLPGGKCPLAEDRRGRVAPGDHLAQPSEPGARDRGEIAG